jgi:hydroxypyruvate isomerase
MNESASPSPISLSRRQLIGTGVAALGTLAVTGTASAGKAAIRRRKRSRVVAEAPAAAEGPVATKGRINHSLVPWCYADYWKTLDEMCGIANKLGCKSIELIPPSDWPTLKKHGLTCAIAPSHLFVQGMNNPKYQAGCIEMLTKRIDECAAAGVHTVITFTGYAEESGGWAGGANPDLSRLPPNRFRIDPEQGAKNCVEGFKKIVGYAEQKKINLAIEILNSRDASHPMKGHPGYQGDHVEYCMDIVRRVGSPRLGLLFDIYHVQIMDGDIIRRVKACGDAIKHVHTAGNPGRGELDDKQEINYPPIMRALVEIGYRGFVGHEFIPTRDPLQGLTEAVKLCDV